MRILRPKIHTRKLAQRNNSFRYSGRIQCKGQQFFYFLIIERSFDSRIPFIALLNRSVLQTPRTKSGSPDAIHAGRNVHSADA